MCTEAAVRWRSVDLHSKGAMELRLVLLTLILAGHHPAWPTSTTVVVGRRKHPLTVDPAHEGRRTTISGVKFFELICKVFTFLSLFAQNNNFKNMKASFLSTVIRIKLEEETKPIFNS